MSNFKTFVLTAVLAVGGLTGAAAIDSPLLGSAMAEAAGGTKYFSTYSAAKSYADQKKSQGYYTSVLKTTGGLYMVEYWTKH